MANDFLNRLCQSEPKNCDCQSNHIETIKPYLGYPTGNNQALVDFPIDPLPFNSDFLAAQYVVSTVASELAEVITGYTETGGDIIQTPDGGYRTTGARTGNEKDPSMIPSVDEIATMITAALSEAGASSSTDASSVAASIHDALASGGTASTGDGGSSSGSPSGGSSGGSSGGPSGALDGAAALAALAAMLAGAISSAFGENGAVGAITSDMDQTGDDSSGGGDDGSSGGGESGGGGGGGASDGGGLAAEDLREPVDRAMEFLNDLDFLYQQLDSEQQSASPAIKDLKFSYDGHLALMGSKEYELLSKALSTYDGYREEFVSIHWPTAFPQISPPGIYSFEDSIETALEKVKRYALKSISLAQIFLSVIPSLFTFDPNRTREANRRCRTLKYELYKKIAMLPTMLDLWDGIGEWTTTYNIAETIDYSQLYFETWGGYLAHSHMTPRLVRKSVARKNFTEDRILNQTSYNTVNDFFQYCMTDAYNKEEYVENSSYETYRLEWDERRLKLLLLEDEHPGVPTTTYKTQNLTWVGEKLKGDVFYNTIIQYIAQPFIIMFSRIAASVPLIEYLFHKAEITTIKTYDWNTRIDFRRLAITDYRGFKRMNEFKRLDRSGLDVINNE